MYAQEIEQISQQELYSITELYSPSYFEGDKKKQKFLRRFLFLTPYKLAVDFLNNYWFGVIDQLASKLWLFPQDVSHRVMNQRQQPKPQSQSKPEGCQLPSI